MVSPDARSAAPQQPFAPYDTVRELGARPNPVYAVRQGMAGGKVQLAVAERFVGAAEAGNEAGALFLAEARRIATLANPDLARVREVAVRGDDVVVFAELVEGEKLHTLWRTDKLPLEIAVRVVVDTLAGAAALHNLRDAKQQPMKLAHGEISPATIVLGVDGVSRLLHAVSRRAPEARPDAASLGYMAPEVHVGEGHDARADVFSAGVLLWEALSGKPLFEEGSATAIVERVRAGALPAADVPAGAPWAHGLVEVVAKALAASPADRWPTASAMAAEIRKRVGLKLAPASTTSAFAKSTFGESVKARHCRLEADAPAASLDEARSQPEEPSVIVAPGLRAPVAEVIELGSETDLEVVPENVARPAPPPAPAPVSVPPPPPEVFTSPFEPLVAPAAIESPAAGAEPLPPASAAPFESAAIDMPAPAPEGTPPPPDTAPSLAKQAEAEEADALERSIRRRKMIVLGGVGLLGLSVFSLAGLRLAHRETGAGSTATAQAAAIATAPTGEAASAPATVAAPAPPPPPTPAPAPPPATASTPPASAVAAASRPESTHAPAAKPKPAAAPSHASTHTKHAAPPAHSKPKSKPKFDPNSL